MIEIIDDDNHNTEFYSYLMTNESTSYSTLNLKYNGTCIYSTQVVTLDSGRLTTIVPLSSYIKYEGKTYKYKYFIKDCKEKILRDFLFDYPKGYDNSEEMYAMKCLNEIVVEFESEDEKENFEYKYLKNISKENLEKYCNGYDYAGVTKLEIEVNKKSIGFGKYIKDKYNTYKIDKEEK